MASTSTFSNAVYSRASAAETANNDSGAIYWARARNGIAVDCSVTAFSGTAPTITFFVDRLGADDVYYPIYSGSAISTASTLSLSIGPGQTTDALVGIGGRLRWTIGGSATPTVTFSASVVSCE